MAAVSGGRGLLLPHRSVGPIQSMEPTARTVHQLLPRPLREGVDWSGWEGTSQRYRRRCHQHVPLQRVPYGTVGSKQVLHCTAPRSLHSILLHSTWDSHSDCCDDSLFEHIASPSNTDRDWRLRITSHWTFAAPHTCHTLKYPYSLFCRLYQMQMATLSSPRIPGFSSVHPVIDGCCMGNRKKCSCGSAFL